METAIYFKQNYIRVTMLFRALYTKHLIEIAWSSGQYFISLLITCTLPRESIMIELPSLLEPSNLNSPKVTLFIWLFSIYDCI